MIDHKSFTFQPTFPPEIVITSFSASDWWKGFYKGALPQIPLTTLNSIISVCEVIQSLYPNEYPSRNSVSYSIGTLLYYFLQFFIIILNNYYFFTTRIYECCWMYFWKFTILPWYLKYFIIFLIK